MQDAIVFGDHIAEATGILPTMEGSTLAAAAACCALAVSDVFAEHGGESDEEHD